MMHGIGGIVQQVTHCEAGICVGNMVNGCMRSDTTDRTASTIPDSYES